MLNSTKQKLIAGICLAATVLPFSVANAATCTNGGGTVTLNTSDVNVVDTNGTSKDATACSVNSNPNSTNQTTELQNYATSAFSSTSWGTDSFTYVAKYGWTDNGTLETVSNTWGGWTFTLTGGSGKSGDFLLTLAPNVGLPTFLDFVFAINGGNAYEGFYFFNELGVDASNNGTWKVTFPNGGGKIPNLSHISLLVRDGSTPDCEFGGNCGGQRVPEPDALSLIGIGLAGLGFIRRRNRKQRQ